MVVKLQCFASSFFLIFCFFLLNIKVFVSVLKSDHSCFFTRDIPCLWPLCTMLILSYTSWTIRSLSAFRSNCLTLLLIQWTYIHKMLSWLFMMKKSRRVSALATGFLRRCWQLVFFQLRELQGAEELYSTREVNSGVRKRSTPATKGIREIRKRISIQPFKTFRSNVLPSLKEGKLPHAMGMRTAS